MSLIDEKWTKVPELLRTLTQQLTEALEQKDFFQQESENLRADKNRLIEVRDLKDDKIAALEQQLAELKSADLYKIAAEHATKAAVSQARLASIVEATAKEVEIDNALISERDEAIRLKVQADNEVNKLYQERVLPAETRLSEVIPLLERSLDAINKDAETVLADDLRSALGLPVEDKVVRVERK